MCNDTIEIPLIHGNVTTVDNIDSDLQQFSNWRTLFHKTSGLYAHRYVKTERGWRDVPMHRVILERVLGRALIGNERVDHKDGNGLNNCRCNLRLADHTKNAANSKRRSDNQSGFKGVCLHKTTGLWRAYIRPNGKQRSLGYYKTPEEAHEAYKRAAIEEYGEFARFE